MFMRVVGLPPPCISAAVGTGDGGGARKTLPCAMTFVPNNFCVFTRALSANKRNAADGGTAPAREPTTFGSTQNRNSVRAAAKGSGESIAARNHREVLRCHSMDMSGLN